MTSELIVHRWANAADGRWGIEFPVAMDAERLVTASEQMRAALGLGHPDFIVVHLHEGESASATSFARSSARLCVALRGEALARSDVGLGPSVACLLDDVDDDTSLADLCRQSLVAVRFAPAFARRAALDPRQATVLKALLAASRDLGLAALGPLWAEGERPSSASFDFDYTLDSTWHDRRRHSQDAHPDRRRLPVRQFEISR